MMGWRRFGGAIIHQYREQVEVSLVFAIAAVAYEAKTLVLAFPEGMK
jgi:hypothetical protein